MEVYVVYQLGYTGVNELEVLGVFRNIEEARKVYKKYIEDNIKDYDYDYDCECPYCDDISLGECMTRLFGGGYQENWDNYLEFHIVKQEVK